MRSLVVAQDFPWPVSLGSHLRLAQVVEAFAGLGDTDLFAFVPARRRSACVLPPELTNVRLKTVVRPPPLWSPGLRLRWLEKQEITELFAGTPERRTALERDWAEVANNLRRVAHANLNMRALVEAGVLVER